MTNQTGSNAVTITTIRRSANVPSVIIAFGGKQTANSRLFSSPERICPRRGGSRRLRDIRCFLQIRGEVNDCGNGNVLPVPAEVIYPFMLLTPFHATKSDA